MNFKKAEPEVAYGAEDIAYVIDQIDDDGNPNIRKTYYMLERGYVAGARKVGNTWSLSIPTYRRAMHGEAV